MHPKSCCNLFGKRNHNVRDRLRFLTQQHVETAEYLGISDLVAGEMKICSTCRLQLSKQKAIKKAATIATENVMDDVKNYFDAGGENIEEETASIASEVIDREQFVRELNKLLPEIGVQQIEYRKINRSISYCRNIMDDITKNMACKIFGLTPSTLHEPTTERSDTDEVVEQLIEKFAQTSDKEEKWKILSILPQSWTANKMHAKFNISWRFAKNVKSLVAEKGIMCGPMKRLASNVMSQDLVDMVKKFYLSEDISHTCPGKRDYVTINENNEKSTLQRRLLLMNLDEAYASFKISHIGTKISFSKFAELKPPQCILTLQTGGTHSVCVCVYHQNVKLIFEPMKKLFGMDSYRNLFDLLLCNQPTEKCKLRECDLCSGVLTVENFIAKVLEDNSLYNVAYKQWVNQSGKTNLENIKKSSDVFISEFSKQVDLLVPHDFIAKKQAYYLKMQKEALETGEFVVICDFSENYSFVIQNAVQSQYWSHDQCTIHPFSIYFKDDSNDVGNLSVIIIAESLNHNFSAVFQFQKELLLVLRARFKDIKRISFFSDGAASQYKNRKNFYQLCQWKDEEHFDAEWHFFATSHGKGPCDGIGGAFKRNAMRASLQRPFENQLTNAKELYEWAIKKESTICYRFCSKESFENVEAELISKFKNVQTITGTQKLHSFISINNREIKTRRYSASENFLIYQLIKPS